MLHYTVNMSLSRKSITNVVRIFKDIQKKLDDPLFSIVEMLPEAVEHIVAVLEQPNMLV